MGLSQTFDEQNIPMLPGFFPDRLLLWHADQETHPRLSSEIQPYYTKNFSV